MRDISRETTIYILLFYLHPALFLGGAECSGRACLDRYIQPGRALARQMETGMLASFVSTNAYFLCLTKHPIPTFIQPYGGHKPRQPTGLGNTPNSFLTDTLANKQSIYHRGTETFNSSVSTLAV
jgi:hypothetical protein